MGCFASLSSDLFLCPPGSAKHEQGQGNGVTVAFWGVDTQPEARVLEEPIFHCCVTKEHWALKDRTLECWDPSRGQSGTCDMHVSEGH